MNVIRTAGPEPLITPADVPGPHAEDDALVQALIDATQAGIDGPTGWVGRAFGEQTLLLTMDRFCRTVRLPYRPVTSILSVKYLEDDGGEETVDSAYWRLASDNTLVFDDDYVFPIIERAPDAVRIEYEAGTTDEGHLALAKAAIIMGVQQIKPLMERDLQLRSEDVEGVGSKTYTVSDASAALVKTATASLLDPISVPWL